MKLKGILSVGFVFMSSLAQAEIVVSDAWVRLLPPTVKTTAAYLTINSDNENTLVSVISPAADRVEMHSSTMNAGMMSMQQVQVIGVSKDKPTILSPQGFHLMLIGLKHPTKEGESYPLTLVFEKGERIEVQALVTRR